MKFKVFHNFWSPEYFSGISATIAVILLANCYGWYTPSINYLIDPHSPGSMTKSQIAWLITTTALVELFFSIPAGLISDKWGRKTCILSCGPLFFISWIAILFFQSYTLRMIIGCIQGIAGGIAFAVVPVYIGEISSTANRGCITGFFSIAWFFGFFLEYLLGAIFSHRLFTILTAVIPFVFTILFAFQPESPYYLVIKGKDSKALSALTKLRGNTSKENVEHELEEIKTSVTNDLETKFSWKDIIDTAADRRALFILILMGFTRSYSGQLAFMTYSSNLFLESGLSLLSPDVLSTILGLSMIISGLVSSSVVDSFGRRPLIIISSIGSVISLLIVGIFFFFKEKTIIDVSLFSWVVPLGIIFYNIFIVLGIFPVTVTYASELFTNKTRGLAASISTVNLNIGSCISVKLYQIISEHFDLFSVFVYFTFMAVVGGISLYFFAPETKGKTFTEIRNDLINVTENRSQNSSHV